MRLREIGFEGGKTEDIQSIGNGLLVFNTKVAE